MNVIIKDMPTNCKECMFAYWDMSEFPRVKRCVFDDYEIYSEMRHIECPLKSIDDLIYKINEINEFSRDEIEEMYMTEILNTIKEYCEVE